MENMTATEVIRRNKEYWHSCANSQRSVPDILDNMCDPIIKTLIKHKVIDNEELSSSK